MKTVKATITIQPDVLGQVRVFAKQHGRSISSVIEEGVKVVMSKKSDVQLKKMYEGLGQIEGIGGDLDSKHKNKSVDEVLYGEDGVWKGDL